jgi:hypothetical protein
MRTSAQPRAATVTPPMRPAAPGGGPGRSAFDSGGRLPTSPAATRPEGHPGRGVVRSRRGGIRVRPPRLASYHSMWASLQSMTWPRLLLVAAAAAGSMASYWVLVRSVLPGLRLREAAVVNLGSPQWRTRCPRAAPWPRGSAGRCWPVGASAPLTTCSTPWYQGSGMSSPAWACRSSPCSSWWLPAGPAPPDRRRGRGPGLARRRSSRAQPHHAQRALHAACRPGGAARSQRRMPTGHAGSRPAHHPWRAPHH